MNKTHQLFLLFFGLLLSAGCLSGCIKDDLSDCPIGTRARAGTRTDHRYFPPGLNIYNAQHTRERYLRGPIQSTGT